jgi:hypothetical protein
MSYVPKRELIYKLYKVDFKMEENYPLVLESPIVATEHYTT